MRILFICGSIEAGCDGVGDYSRLIARELSGLGADVRICALSDSYCVEPVSIESDQGLPCGFRGLRLPYSMAWAAKKKELLSWLGQWGPTIVSLQYVPYSFSPRGMPFGLASCLKGMFSGDVMWHVMFHEIWVGITRRSPWKHHVVGFIQKRIAQNLVRVLAPKICHTSNALYVTILGDAGIPAVRLPICSNISITKSEEAWMWGELNKLGISESNRDEWWIVGMFGSCYPDVPVESLVNNAIGDSVQLGRKAVFLGVGGGEGTGAAWEARVRACARGAQVVHFGRQSNGRISAFLSILNQGITNTPCEYVGKSGSAAAMWAHGVSLDTRYHIDLPEYRGRWGENIPIDELFMSSNEIAGRMLDDLGVVV